LDEQATLFLAGLDYKVTEKDLEQEMSRYGKVKSVKLIRNIKTGEPRGYAFVEFEQSKDMKCC